MPPLKITFKQIVTKTEVTKFKVYYQLKILKGKNLTENHSAISSHNKNAFSWHKKLKYRLNNSIVIFSFLKAILKMDCLKLVLSEADLSNSL